MIEGLHLADYPLMASFKLSDNLKHANLQIFT